MDLKKELDVLKEEHAKVTKQLNEMSEVMELISKATTQKVRNNVINHVKTLIKDNKLETGE